jgi:hypothetical protein
MNSKNSEKKKVLFFSPFAGIWPHVLAELNLAKVISSKEWECEFLGCKGFIGTFCTVMESEGIDILSSRAQKYEICQKCISNSSLIKEKNDFEHNFLDDFYFRSLDESSIPQFDSSTPIAELITYKFRNFEVGKIAIYETLIKFKKNNLIFSVREIAYYLQSIENCVQTVIAAERFFKSNSFDALICYSPQYGVPGIFSEVAKSFGLQTIFVEGSSSNIERYTRLRIWNWQIHGLNQPGLQATQEFDRYKMRFWTLLRVLRQVREIRSAKSFSVYSSRSTGKKTREVFNIEENRKILLVCMSSYDEVFSGIVLEKIASYKYFGEVFSDQIAWLNGLKVWAEARPDVVIIVRPHPREVANKRESEVAGHVEEWTKVFETLPKNMHIDWPEHKFSLYDHFKSVNAVTTGWSFSGVEAMLRGLPTVTYDSRIASYPNSIHRTGESEAEYYRNLDLALSHGKSKQNTIRALRWLSFLSERGTFKVGGLTEDRFFILKNKWLQKVFRSKFLVVSYTRILRSLELGQKPSSRHRDRIIDILNEKSSSLFDLSGK